MKTVSKYGKYTKGMFVVACFSPGFSNDIFVIDGYDLFGPVLCYSNLKKRKKSCCVLLHGRL